MEESKEEQAIILDFLPNGYPFDNRPMFRKTAIAQAIGTSHFSLLELIPKKEAALQSMRVVYIGEGKRDEIHHVSGKLLPEKLTETAKHALEEAVKELVAKDKAKFVEFFNKAGAITTRMHSIELLPGIGKKHMWEIVEKRQDKPFESFGDMRDRIKLLPDPEKAIVKRIISEINNEDKYKLFVK
ncbi:MAG: DUF655 domain-containing protein [Candidatus Nanoarchaeia archaeon]|nr:DUF655 domain-containing protein [Candidatus Nanoarchaeia archaeon]